MTGSLLAVDVARAIFMARNGHKTINGDIGRAPVTGVHAVSIMEDVAKSNLGQVSGVAGKVTGTINKLGADVLKIEQMSSVASKAINPLLCVAAAGRVIKDENKEAALTEEAIAMGVMFGAETLIKGIKMPIEALVKAGAGNVDTVAKELAESKGLASKIGAGILSTKTGRGLAEKVATMAGKSSGKQKLLFVGSGILFAVTSILGYSLGKKLGEKVSGRADEKKAQDQENFFLNERVSQYSGRHTG